MNEYLMGLHLRLRCLYVVGGPFEGLYGCAPTFITGFSSMPHERVPFGCVEPFVDQQADGHPLAAELVLAAVSGVK
jgi:hypothetical protein